MNPMARVVSSTAAMEMRCGPPTCLWACSSATAFHRPSTSAPATPPTRGACSLPASNSLRSESMHTHGMPLVLPSSLAQPSMRWRLGPFFTLPRHLSGGARVSMGLRTGIVGLPNVGKSTLFNALVENGKAQAANFPFCTIEPNVGVVAVPDPRLQVLSTLGKSQRTVPNTVEFVDIAGLVKGASEGEGLGNKFLSHIREVDSIVQVVRCFEDTDIVHVNGLVDPAADMDIINLELALSDIAQIEKRLERLKKGSKDPKVKAKEEVELETLTRIHIALLAGSAARSVELSDEEKPLVKHLCLLTSKPLIYAANVSEDDLADPSRNTHLAAVRNAAAEQGAEVVIVSAQVEAELSELAADERKEYLESLGVEEGGLASLVRATYGLLGLRTYFTCGEKETRAWPIIAGMTAPQAAGVIHTDFEKGFIRAETVAYDDFVAAGSFNAAKEKGLMRSEGKDYVVHEGDVMLFRFNV